MLINYSNHPSSLWSPEQVKAASSWGAIIDIPFAQVSPALDRIQILKLAEIELNKILNVASKESVTVHIMGEMTLTYNLVNLLKEKGIKCVASTTDRITSINEKGDKVSTFKFVRFREY